jgi:hypothetical protein
MGGPPGRGICWGGGIPGLGWKGGGACWGTPAGGPLGGLITGAPITCNTNHVKATLNQGAHAMPHCLSQTSAASSASEVGGGAHLWSGQHRSRSGSPYSPGWSCQPLHNTTIFPRTSKSFVLCATSRGAAPAVNAGGSTANERL